MTDIYSRHGNEGEAEPSAQEAQRILEELAGSGRGEPRTTDRRPRIDPPSAPLSEPQPKAASQGHVLSGDKFRSLLEAVPDALVIVNEAGGIVLVNGQTERMFGYRREELHGLPIEVLVPERFRAGHVERRNSYFRDPHTRPMGQSLELSGRRKDGQEFPVEISLSPMRAEEGLLVIATIRDVSERKRIEGQLRKAETRYRTLVEEIPAVTFMAVLDSSEGVGANEIYVSPQIEELLGFSQREWVENPILWYSQLHPDDQVRWNAQFAPTCRTGEPYQGTYRFISKDGRVVWVHGSARVVRNAEGEPIFLQGIAFDITAIKQAEVELKAINETLDQRVKERTQAAEDKARELERSNQALTDFAQFVGHEVKKPVGRIKEEAPKLRPLLEEKRDPEAGQLLQGIVRQADNAWRMIERMLEYARVGGGTLKFRPTACAVLFREARDRLKGSIEEAGAVVTAGRLPTVLGDQEHLMLVFENLIGNALKYRSPTRALKVRVGAEAQGSEWLLWVKDNGEGIRLNPKNPEFIFGLFKRNHGEKIPGYGIGLAFCKKVIEHHGGRIWVESTYGKGSTFFFTLPAPPPESPSEPEQPPPTETRLLAPP